MFGATQIYLYIALLAWSMFGAVSVIEKFLLDKPVAHSFDQFPPELLKSLV